MVATNNVEKIKLDLTDENALAEKKELARTKEGGIPLMIIYPSDPSMPGVLMNGTPTSGDAIKALKYAINYSEEK